MTPNKANEYLNDFSISGNAIATIDIADGTYQISEAIEITHPDANRIVIDGNTGTPANVIIQTTAAVNAIEIIGNGQPVMIQGLTLDGNGTGTNGVFVSFNSKANFANMIVDDFTVNGFFILNSSNVTITICTASNNTATGISVNNDSRVYTGGGVITLTNNATGIRAGNFSSARIGSVTASGNGTDFSPTVTAGDTPTYGNDMGIISQ
ncbi:hypothetical protein DRO66_05885 [Candidatus Bathyarchaeota archaeon]|nr:MAG: hypothetical protein DRO66_05885 [Candidatus Bathyarchaeota archaeon]